jgi:hypothetical protein
MIEFSSIKTEKSRVLKFYFSCAYNDGMNSYNERQKRNAEVRRKQIRSLRAKVPRWTWKRIGKRFGVSTQRAQQLGRS